MVWSLPFLLALALVALLSVPAQSPFHTIVEASDDDTESVPGPCEDGYVAPTPVNIPVTSVPITVTSTTGDYFVLYAETTNFNGRIGYHNINPTSTLPVSVTLGEDGTTTLVDNLEPLPASKYRVKKFSVAQPGDLDGDCVDDLTELADLGNYNPVNPAKKVARWQGAAAIDSLTTFQELSLRGDWKLGGLSHHGNLEWINYVISRAQTDQPVLHFINSRLGVSHGAFHKVTGVPVQSIYSRGSIVYHPSVAAPDGSLGIYRFSFDWLERGHFEEVQKYNEILAASMPVLKNNLYYYPTTAEQKKNYNRDKSEFDASRINVLTQEDILGDVDFIAMNQGEGYGRLRHMQEGERPSPFDIAIYEALPNDLPRVAGTITTVPQTPLSHVNLRAIQNNLPNAFIQDALTEESITALLGKYVYYAVTADGYTIRAATKADVDKHFESLRPQNTQTLQSDLTKKTITSLDNVSFADWTAFGVKAANVAELTRLSFPDGTTPVGYAVPFYFYVEFMKQATLGEETILGKKKAPDAEKITLPAGTTLAAAVTAMLAHAHFKTDADIQEEMLDDLRKAIKKAESPDWIITALENLHDEYPDGQSLRYRSSTNNEDLPSFSGAGLYSSKTQRPAETTEEGIDKSIKQVWASLWNYRAFLERDFHRVDHNTVVMGVLVHPNYDDELVNGVAVSYDPITFQDDLFYVNSQKGEDLVTNPEAHSQPEQILLGATGQATILSRSNLVSSNRLLMTDAQMRRLRSNLGTIHNRFKTLYGVQDGEDFAIEIEFKITAANKLAIKQARPWIFPEPLTLAKPEVTLALGSAQVAEGETLELTATRSGGIQSTPLTVDLSWSETRAMLANSKPASVTIPGNQTSATITVPLDDDEEDEHESMVTVSIAANDGYTIGTPGSASATVTDDDQTTIGVRGSGTVTEGSPVGFNFTRSGSVLEQSLSVNITVTDPGSRLQGAAPTTVTFLANSATASISLPTANDSVWTGPSVVTVQIGAGSDYGIGGAGKAGVTIEDDELPPPTPPTLYFDFNHAVHHGNVYVLKTPIGPTTGALSTAIDGPDANHFTDYIIHQILVFDQQDYNHPADANQDGVYEIDVTASDSLDGTITVRMRFTVVNAELISLAQQQWDQLSQDQRATLLPEVANNLLKPKFANLKGDVWASVLRLARQGLLPWPGPTISIAGGGDVTEGGDAIFTVTANPPPTAALPVGVSITQSGDYGATTGSQTVSIPTGGSYTLTIPTSNDSADEADGSVTATVNQGNGYVVSWRTRTATVAVSDDDDPPPGATPEISIAAGAGITEGGDATFTITASPAPVTPITVNVGVTEQGDFGASGAATVTVSGTTTTYTVTTSDDSVDEANGSVTATLNAGHGYTVSATAATVTVSVSDDDVPEVSITSGSGVTEGDSAQFTITASPAPAGPITINVGVTQSGDFGASGAATVTLNGATTTYTVTTSNDAVDEADGSVTAILNAGTGYTVSTSQGAATVAVADDDDPPADQPDDDAAATACVTADQALLAQVEAKTQDPWDGGRPDLLEMFIRSYDAMQGSDDYTTADIRARPDKQAAEWQGNGPNALWQSIYAELDSLEACRSGQQGEPETPEPTPEISVSGDGGVTEGGSAEFTVTASPEPGAALTVSVTVSATGDYGVTTGTQTVTIPTTGSATLTVATVDDAVDETDGSVTATVDAGSGYTVSSSQGTATVAVSDDDVPEISITAGSGVTEGGSAQFTITASPAPRANLSVSVTVSATGDYGVTTGTKTVTIPTGGTATLTVSTTGDSLDEADGSVTVTLQSGTGYDVSSSASWATVAVSDDDDPAPQQVPEISITGGGGITEGGTAQFTITASPAPASPITVNVGVSEDGDFGASGPATVTVSGSTTIYTIATSDDGVDEADGSVTATLEDGQGYTVSSSAGSATVTVADDDVPEISITGGNGVTEGSAASFTLTADPVPAAGLDVSVTVSASGDYGVTTGTQSVTIPTTGSATLTVATSDDGLDEADGSVTATLKAGSGYTVSSSQGTATVAVSDDDDTPEPERPAGGATVSSITTEKQIVNLGGKDAIIEFMVTLSEPASEGGAAIDFKTEAPGWMPVYDYELVPSDDVEDVSPEGFNPVALGRLTIGEGETEGTIEVKVLSSAYFTSRSVILNVVIGEVSGEALETLILGTVIVRK